MDQPLNNVLATEILQAFERFAKTTAGKQLLEQCRARHCVIRGSGGMLASRENLIFSRVVSDLDLQLSNPLMGLNDGEVPHAMRTFVSDALRDIEVDVVQRPHTASIKDKIQQFVYPKLSFKIKPKAAFLAKHGIAPSSAHEDSYTFKLDINCYNAIPDHPLEDMHGTPVPIDSKDFFCLENLLVRLAGKVMALNNTKRYSGAEPEKNMRQCMVDMLDTFNLYELAVHRYGSEKEVLQGLTNIYRSGFLSHYNVRKSFETLDNLASGYLFASGGLPLPKQQMESRISNYLSEAEALGTLTVSKQHADKSNPPFTPFTPSTIVNTCQSLITQFRQHMPPLLRERAAPLRSK